MPWLQVSFSVTQSQAPVLEAVLENAGALAVTLGDAGDDPQFEPAPGAMPLWEGVGVTALFEDKPESRATVLDLAERLGPACLAAPVIQEIADRPWERVWLDDFRPTRFGRRLWVCPQGQTAPDPQAVVVDLDPGLAFGTGHHPTTALCLEWLDGVELEGRTVLDYGCGSGILAIAALKLGARLAIALDHDPQAIDATRANALRNGVADRILPCRPEALHDLGHLLPVDVVLANILAGTLVELAPAILETLAPGGRLVLSGILADQADRVAAAYLDRVRLSAPRLRDDWALIAGTVPCP